MKNFFLYLTAVLMMFALIGCSESSEIITESYNEKQSISSSDTSEAITEDSFDSSEESEEYMIYIKTENSVMEAKLCENQSAAALYDLLKENDITVNMSDYGNFEKVGELGVSLPRCDEQITTQAGDLILYQGDKFVIYYDTNSWSFTKLGKIQNISADSLKNILGSGDVTVTLSLSKD